MSSNIVDLVVPFQKKKLVPSELFQFDYFSLLADSLLKRFSAIILQLKNGQLPSLQSPF